MNNHLDNIIYFNSNNNNTVNNFTILYNISIETTYSSVCTIDISILQSSSNCDLISSKINKNMTKVVFKNLILNNILCINSDSLINGFDFIALIVSSDKVDPKEEIKKGISGINLDNCVSELKTHYNITDDHNLLVLEAESKDTENRAISLEVYDDTGRKLDLAFCKSKIKVMKNLELEGGIDIQIAKEFSEQGIDVFNAEDKFFNDICHPLKIKRWN